MTVREREHGSAHERTDLDAGSPAMKTEQP